MAVSEKWYRIGELERLTGLPRRTIHFYVQCGLLHPPRKTGRTMAYYDEAHRRKLGFIRKEKRKGLPLTAIRQRIQEREEEGETFGGTGPASGTRPGAVAPARRREPRKAQGRNTRERILAESCRVFRQQGFKNTTVGDITRRLGIGKGSFYFYFSDKKELFLECVPRLFVELFSQGWEEIRKEEDPFRRLELRARAILPVAREFCTILELGKEAMKDEDPNLKRLGEQIYTSVRRPLEADVSRGIRQGRFRSLDPTIVGALLVGVIESLDYLLFLDPALPLDAFLETVVALVGEGLRKRD